MKKRGKMLMLAVLLLILAGTGVYYGGLDLQGKIKSSTSSTPSPAASPAASVVKVLTVIPDTKTYNTITLSDVDFSDEEKQWFAVAKFNYEFASNVYFCDDGDEYALSSMSFGAYEKDGSFINSSNLFDDTRLLFVSASGSRTYVELDSSDKFKREEGVSFPEKGTIYVEVNAKEEVDAAYKGQQIDIALGMICAKKLGNEDLIRWHFSDSFEENAFFNITAKASYGLVGGWVAIED